MEAVRVTKDKEWLKAGVYFVRTQAMCFGFDVPLEMEFEDDTAEQEYILVLDDGKPVSTCRVSVKRAWDMSNESLRWNPTVENILERQAL